MRLFLLLLISFSLFLSVVGSNLPQAGSIGSIENGKNLYAKYCSTCHGLDGKGEGSAAVYLSPKPRDFTRGIFKFQSNPAGSLPTDDDLLRTIRQGMPGSAMPAWDRLSDNERSDLADFIKTFSDRFTAEKPPEPLVIEKEPLPTPEMVRNGKAVYALAGCWMCHGTTGKGGGPSSKDLRDDNGRPIVPYDFTRAGAFKGGGSPKDIYRTFSTGIGGTPMPEYGEDALAIGRETAIGMANLEGQYSNEEVQGFKKLVSRWPAEAELSKMSRADRKKLGDDRRWSLVYYVLSLAGSGQSQISYTTTDHSVTSQTVDDVSRYADPESFDWNDLDTVELPLISLWQRDTPIDRLVVKSISDGKKIAFRLEWKDPTKDDGALYNAQFGDAAAIQFPLDPASDPFFGMGDTNFVVNIWHWKSWWERDLQRYAGVNSAFPRNATVFYPFDVAGGSRAEYFANRDSAKKLSMTWNAGWGSGNLLSAHFKDSPIEDLNAKGFGTLTSQGPGGQNVTGKGVWKDGKWTVVFTRSLETQEASDANLKRGTTMPIAFAVWDGSLRDRNGQKMVTDWYRLTISVK